MSRQACSGLGLLKTIEETPESHRFRTGVMSYIAFLTANPELVSITVVVAELSATPTNEVSESLEMAI